MKIGVADFVGFDFTPLDFLHFAKSLSVKYVEFKFDYPRFLEGISNFESRKTREALEADGIRAIVHLPHLDMNLASANPFVQSASEEALAKSILKAEELDAELLVTHVGRLSKVYTSREAQRARERATSSLRRLLEKAKAHNMKLTVENDRRSPNYAFAELADDLRAVADDVGCEVTLDIGHANTATTNLCGYVETLKGLVANVHLHDNHGVADEHLALGKGSAMVDRALTKLKNVGYSGPLVLEVHSLSGVSASVASLLHILKKI